MDQKQFIRCIYTGLILFLFLPFVNASYEIVNQSGDIDCGADEMCSGSIYLNITSKDHTFDGFKIEKNQTTTGKTKDVYAHMDIYHWKKAKWEHIAPDKDFKLVRGVHHLVVNGTKDGKSTIKWGIPQINLDPYWYGDPVGWEYQQNWSVHLWNEIDDYYINNSDDVLLSNHWDEVWAKNIFTITIQKGFDFYQYDVSDLDMNWTPSTNNTNYVNYTGNKIINVSGDEVNFTLTYSLVSNASDMEIYPLFENLGDENLSVTFQWHMHDIKIFNDTYEGDYVFIDGQDKYFLNETLDLIYTNLTYREVWVYDAPSDERLYLFWDYDHNYTLSIQNESGEYNAPINLFIDVGTIRPNESERLRFNWVDAKCSWSCLMNAPTTNLDIQTGDQFFMDARITYAGSCNLARTATAKFNGTTINSTTPLSLASGNNPESGVGFCIFGQCDFTGWDIDADVEDFYSIFVTCTFDGKGLNSAAKWVNVTQPEENYCDAYNKISSSFTLTANNDSCFNITASDVIFDCKGYKLTGDRFDNYTIISQHTDNLTIKDCFLEDQKNGIYFFNVSNSLIYNTTMFNFNDTSNQDTSTIGINLTSSDNNTITLINISDFFTNSTSDSNCWDTYCRGITLFSSDNTKINDTHIQNLWGEQQGLQSESCHSASRPNKGTGIYLHTSSNNNLIDNVNITQVREYGFWIFANFNNFTNININDSERGFVSSEDNLLLDNISINFSEGIALSFSDSNQIATNIQIFGASSGISVSASSVTLDTIHIQNTSSTDSSIGDLDLFGTSISAHNITILDSNQSGADSAAIYMGIGATMNNTYINNSFNGITFRFSADNSDFHNLIMENMINSTFILQAGGVSNIDTFNSSYNKSQVRFDAAGDVENYYYLTVNVTDDSNSALENALVNVTDSWENEVGDYTDVNGLTQTWTLLESNITQSEGITFISPYNITGQLAGYSTNSSVLDLNFSQLFHLILPLSDADCWTYFPGTKFLSIPTGCLYDTSVLFEI